MNKQKKEERRALRIQALRELTSERGLQLAEYGAGRHLRIFGVTVVDYWPGSGKCWITGSEAGSRVIEPPDVIQVATAADAPDYVLAHLADNRAAHA